MIGEMSKFNGNINVSGSTSYVSQQPWIINETILNNIIFGKEMNQSFYNRTIEGCALNADLNMLPARDYTEIGERVLKRA
jgi:ATP-binding cassette, subfamily C (CFTR/MRP), member 1